MIAALLNFLFIILLGIFIVVGVVAYKIYLSLIHISEPTRPY
mgnify:CR=1 FL=1